MNIYINILPYMNDIKQLNELLLKWKGGVEVITEGESWWDNSLDWENKINNIEFSSRPISVHAPIFDLNLASIRYKVISEYSFEVYKRSIQWAAKIGAEHIVIHPNLQTTPLFHLEDAQGLSKFYLKKLGKLGKQLGVEVLVENVGFHQCMLFDEDEFIQLFNEIDSISPLLDIGHAHINGWNSSKVIRSLGERLKAVHLHDNDGKQDLHMPIGSGTIQWNTIWEALKPMKDTTKYILEYDTGTSTERVIKDISLIKEKLDS